MEPIDEENSLEDAEDGLDIEDRRLRGGFRFKCPGTSSKAILGELRYLAFGNRRFKDYRKCYGARGCRYNEKCCRHPLGGSVCYKINRRFKYLRY